MNELKEINNIKLKEHIKHCEEVIQKGNACEACINDHRELKQLLEELLELREKFSKKF